MVRVSVRWWWWLLLLLLLLLVWLGLGLVMTVQFMTVQIKTGNH